MTNLATLIGVENLQLLIQNDENTYVVREINGTFERLKKHDEIDYSEVVGIGSFKDCQALVYYLSLQKISNL